MKLPPVDGDKVPLTLFDVDFPLTTLNSCELCSLIKTFINTPPSSASTVICVPTHCPKGQSAWWEEQNILERCQKQTRCQHTQAVAGWHFLCGIPKPRLQSLICFNINQTIVYISTCWRCLALPVADRLGLVVFVINRRRPDWFGFNQINKSR